MSDLSRRQLVAYVLAGVVLVLAGARWVRASNVRSAASPTPSEEVRSAGQASGLRLERSGGEEIVVHVAGEVRHPGVYRLHGAVRVDDVLRRAGGTTRRADLTALNLAAKVDDGRQVIVPRRAATAGGASATAGTSAAGGADGTAAGGAAPTTPINLNTATAEQLGTLDGVGPATAQKIIAYRQQHGGFGSVDELDQVPGIGPKRLEALRPHLTA